MAIRLNQYTTQVQLEPDQLVLLREGIDLSRVRRLKLDTFLSNFSVFQVAEVQ